MRTVQVSTEVFAAIWAAHAVGEDTEDQILRRVSGVKKLADKPAFAERSGYTNMRYGFSVPEGSRIERTFKGRAYEAHAAGGGWKLIGSDEIVSSPTALSEAINTGIENVWNNWCYTDEAGSVDRSPTYVTLKRSSGGASSLSNFELRHYPTRRGCTPSRDRVGRGPRSIR